MVHCPSWYGAVPTHLACLQGLDPASRRNLWDVVKAGRVGRGIILTTHSMQEAEVLCDRLGIFVDGRLVCIGPPKEIAARYGKYLVRSASAVDREIDTTLCVGGHCLQHTACCGWEHATTT